MMSSKRPATSVVLAPTEKKYKQELALSSDVQNRAILTRPRTSSLESPIMLLSGHEEEVFCGKFSPCGTYLATAGFDRTIFLWNTFGDCENFAVLNGHGGAIMDLCFNTEGDIMYTCATDKTLALWDMETGERIKRFKGHQSFVNSCDVARRCTQTICTGADDGTIRLWDRRHKNAVHCLENTYQILSVAFSDNGENVYSGGIDNVIRCWDIRKLESSMKLCGHRDTITGLSVSPDGSHVLSNSMDNSLRMWDLRPYIVGNDRCVKTFQGHSHAFDRNLLRCSWSKEGKRVSCGSGDRYVYVWDSATRHILYKLPGHTGTVNCTAFHPSEPIILSTGSDRKVFLGEIVST